ncbi:unnamed protein product [Periconia digitata]|uniref:Zn(2)-C6 fungal-type domain-containing protein n=1 Tax=Periconia digitata TaxID=1303443 RepID=A0A9W4URD7_9PLEO|nr:unnamed protein product [Periconia digitata]
MLTMDVREHRALRDPSHQHFDVTIILSAEQAITGDFLMNSFRRNGKPSSCEPCRLNKTKCDHAVPKCDRCVQRGNQRERLNTSRPAKRKRVSVSISDAFDRDPSLQKGRLDDAVSADIYRAGYLGPTSYEINLPDYDSSLPANNREASAEPDIDLEMSHQHPLNKPIRMQMGTDVLKTFRYYPIIRELIMWYSLHCQAGTVPLPFSVGIIDGLQPIVDRYNLAQSAPSPQLVGLVLKNSSKPLEIPVTMKSRDLHELCSGENLRLDAIGFVLATAGRALAFGSCTHLINEQTHPGLRSKIVDELLRASTLCITLCSLITPINDVLTWMLLDNYHLTIMVCGFSGPPSWRRIGELVNQIYAMGLNRESNAPDVPSWLLETRRRLCCGTYMLDKTISTFLGRPIGMSKRHINIQMPLDLSDETLMADDGTYTSAVQSLDENGWARDQYNRASWARMRYISSQFLEEILDFTFVKVDKNAEEQLLNISNRIHESWEAFPAHLRYWSTCWDEGVLPSVCLMLVVVHQTHFYNEFMIRRLLAQKETITSNLELLRVSITLLTNTLTLGRLRDRNYDVHKDFMLQLILFGIPSASVLATALQEQQRTNHAFPPSISRAKIIRKISVLISHLDVAVHMDSARPGEANYNLCRKACKAFTRVIDNILDPKMGSETGITPTSADIEFDIGLDLDTFAAPGLDAFEGIDYAAAAMGEDGINWGAVSQWTL